MKIVRKVTAFICLFLLASALIQVGRHAHLPADEPASVFSTWEGFEVDKCAAIWLIKRFIDEEAVIRFFPKGTLIRDGVAFDTPEAKFRRYHNMSTFESLLRHCKIKDPKLVFIGEIVHDIEVNLWERKRFDETPIVQEAITRIIRNSESNEEIIQESCTYFDRLYEGLETNAIRGNGFEIDSY